MVLHSSAKFTFHIIYYQQQGEANSWTDFSVCFDTSIECWLDKARIEIVTWATVGVAPQQQFSSKFWHCG